MLNDTVTDWWIGKFDTHGVLYQHDGPHSTEGDAEKSLCMLQKLDPDAKFRVCSVTYKLSKREMLESYFSDEVHCTFDDLVLNLKEVFPEINLD